MGSCPGATDQQMMHGTRSIEEVSGHGSKEACLQIVLGDCAGGALEEEKQFLEELEVVGMWDGN